MAQTDTTLYIAGGFTYVGPYTGSGIPVDGTTGSAVSVFPKVDNRMNVVVSDGAGGWYVGGRFSRVGDMPRNRLAHILSDGTVDSEWNPNANGEVNVLALSPDGNTVYVGGSFTLIGGQPRNRVAALSADTGLATTWNPNANGAVYALAVKDNTVYVGGLFGGIGGKIRDRIAALDANGTGAATDWDPKANSSVYALTVSPDGNTVYAGGFFTNIGGQPLNMLVLCSSAAMATRFTPVEISRTLGVSHATVLRPFELRGALLWPRLGIPTWMRGSIL